MKTPVLASLLLGATIMSAQAQDIAASTSTTATPSASPVAPLKTDTSKPINVTSDMLSADIKANIGIYSGHVVIMQDTLKMRADEVKIIAADGKPSKLEARGNIVFDSPSGSAIGDFGTYDVNSKLITLTGRDVVLTKDKNVMHGTRLEVNLATNQAKLYSVGQYNNRVQGLFVPKSASNEASRKPAAKKPAQTPQP
jgi:lipopolysaccharide export system protein LptA